MTCWNNFQDLGFWRNLAAERVLDSRSGPWGKLEVVQDANSRSLRFGNRVRQSSMLLAAPQTLALPYTRAMMAVELFLEQEPTSALVVGLGGGSLPKFLLHHHPQCQVEVVELREDVVEAAYRWFELPRDPRLQVQVADGIEHLKRDTRSYDLVLLDLFDDQGMIAELEDADFFAACRQRLNERGIAVFNLWNTQKEQYRRYSAHYETAFGIERCLKLPLGKQANVIAFGFTQDLPPDYLRRLAERASALRPLDLDLDKALAQLRRHNPRFARRLRRCR